MAARTRPPCGRCNGTGSLPVGRDDDYEMVAGLESAPLCPDCEGEGETPPRLRRFELHRHEDESGISGTGVVAQGVEFDDGVCVLRWLTEWPTSVVFHDRGAEAVEHVHGHNGRTEVVWLDER